VKLSRRGVVHDGAQVTADAVHHRRDDAHHGVDGNRRVNRIATASQDGRTGLRGQRMLAGSNAAGAQDHGSPLRAIDGGSNVVGDFRGHWE
jgi:hypothetical protein